jgi:hypothetical protein
MNRIPSITTVPATLTMSLALALGASAIAVATNAGPATAGTSQEPSTRSATTFTVHVHHGTDTSLDLGDTGFSAGDQDLFTGPLTRHGTHVGHLVGSCTTARAGKTSADQLCEFVLHLGKAQITTAGTVSSGQQGPSTFTLPILGGTGRYDTAKGQIAVTPSNRATFPVTITLR